MSKRVLFDRNPLDDPIRERMGRETRRHLKGFTHRIPMRRRSPSGSPYWDPLWPSILRKFARQLGIETVTINGGMFTRRKSERDALLARAETIWRSLRPTKRQP